MGSFGHQINGTGKPSYRKKILLNKNISAQTIADKYKKNNKLYFVQNY